MTLVTTMSYASRSPSRARWTNSDFVTDPRLDPDRQCARAIAVLAGYTSGWFKDRRHDQRRSDAKLSIQTWRPLSQAERENVAAEAASLPLPGVQGRTVVGWEDP